MAYFNQSETKSTAPKMPATQIYSEKLLCVMGADNIPWEHAPMPIAGLRVGAYTRDSRTNGRSFRYENQLLGYKPGEYITFNSCKFEHGRVAKGSKCSPMFNYSSFEVDAKDEMNRDIKQRVPIYRYQNYFHLDDTDLMPAYELEESPFAGLSKEDRIKAADKLIDNYIKTIGIKKVSSNEKGLGLYNSMTDELSLPKKSSFSSIASYYQTVFDALIHSTGHESRLKRKGVAMLLANKTPYSAEVLAGHMGACALLIYLGFTPELTKDKKTYVRAWRTAISNDAKLAINAASVAQKACDLIVTAKLPELKKKAEPETEVKPTAPAPAPIEESNTTRVLVCGGRDFSDYGLLEQELDKILEGKSNIEIVSGHANGADALGERYAKAHSLALKTFPADWDGNGRAAGMIRNGKMIDYISEPGSTPIVVAFWDGQSKGTANTIDRARNAKLNLKVVSYTVVEEAPAEATPIESKDEEPQGVTADDIMSCFTALD